MSGRKMTEDEKAAKRAAAIADHEAQLAAYIKRKVDAWPPLTDDQRDRIAILLRPAGSRLYATPAPDLAAIKEEQRVAQALADAKSLSAAVIACDVCDLPPAAHGLKFGHDWVPGRAEKIMRAEACA